MGPTILAAMAQRTRPPTMPDMTLPGTLEGLHYCPVCRNSAGEFSPGPNGRPGARCPSCGALERHRFLSLLLGALAPEIAAARNVLEIAPAAAVTRMLHEASAGHYVGMDIDPKADGRSVSVVGDLCSTPFASGAFDVAVCFHVLEHIPDDRAAMAELARIISPDGIAFLQVPWNRKALTEEDADASPEERRRRFGQADHVRRYGSDWEQRLKDSGLRVIALTAGRLFPPDLVRAAAVSGTIWLVSPLFDQTHERWGSNTEHLIRRRLAEKFGAAVEAPPGAGVRTS